MRTTKTYEVNYCVICRMGHRNSKRVWLLNVFAKDVSLDTIIDTLSRCKTWLHICYNPTHAKQKLLRKPRRAFRGSWSRQGNEKSLTLTTSWSLASPVKNYPGTVVRQHHTDQKRMGFAERAVR